MKLFIFLMIFPFSLLAIDKYELIIKDHKFIPSQLILPVKTKIKLLIKNQDDEVEEFESFDLRREKIIPAKSEITLNIGPLEPGEYKFFGDFHSTTAQGVVIVK